MEGTRLVSCVTPPSQPDGTYGQMSMVGVPSLQAGIGNGGITNGNFANVLVNCDGIMLVPPFNSQISGFNFAYASMANMKNGSVIAFAPINYGAQTCGGPYLRGTNLPTNTVAVALAMPFAQNNDNANIGNFAVMGIAIGLQCSEHITAQRLATVYCQRGIQLEFAPASLINGGSILYWDCEACYYGLYTSGSNTCQYLLFIGSATFESMINAYVYDSNGNLSGQMNWTDFGQTTPIGQGVVGAQNYKIINNRMIPGPWVANANLGLPAAPAAPATGVAQQNTAYRDATCYVTSTAAITAFAVGPTSGALTSVTAAAAIGVAVPVRVPGGFWYSVTSAGGTLTTSWVLD